METKNKKLAKDLNVGELLTFSSGDYLITSLYKNSFLGACSLPQVEIFLENGYVLYLPEEFVLNQGEHYA